MEIKVKAEKAKGGLIYITAYQVYAIKPNGERVTFHFELSEEAAQDDVDFIYEVGNEKYVKAFYRKIIIWK